MGGGGGIQGLNSNETRAAVENGATLTGGGKLTVSADFHHDVQTEDKAGSAGGIPISPPVSLAIVSDKTTAYLGTGAQITVTGDVTISDTEKLSSSTDTNAKTPR